MDEEAYNEEMAAQAHDEDERFWSAVVGELETERGVAELVHRLRPQDRARLAQALEAEPKE